MAPRSRKRRSQALVLPGIIGLFAVLALIGCRKEELTTPEPPAPKVEGETVSFTTNAPQLGSISVQTAQPRTAAVTHLTGRLYWNDDKTVRVFTPVSGRVTAIRVDVGDTIAPGAPLAEIDSPDFSQALAAARTAAGDLAAADKAFSRGKELLQHGAAAQKDVEAAEAAYVAAAAERERAESVLANYGGSDQSTNSIYILRSHLAGVLVEKNINPGQELRADLMLANAPNLFAPGFCHQRPGPSLAATRCGGGRPCLIASRRQLRVWSTNALPDKVFEGRIDKIADAFDPLTRTIKVRGVVNNPDKLLKAEMYVLADVLADPAAASQTGVDVPARALFMKAGDSYVFLESPPAVSTGSGSKWAWKETIKFRCWKVSARGEKVVIEGTLLLQALVEPAS